MQNEVPMEKADLEEEKRKLMTALFPLPGSEPRAVFNDIEFEVRRDAAIAFFALLSLEAQGDVATEQENFWGPILVTKIN